MCIYIYIRFFHGLDGFVQERWLSKLHVATFQVRIHACDQLWGSKSLPCLSVSLTWFSVVLEDWMPVVRGAKGLCLGVSLWIFCGQFCWSRAYQMLKCRLCQHIPSDVFYRQLPKCFAHLLKWRATWGTGLKVFLKSTMKRSPFRWHNCMRMIVCWQPDTLSPCCCR